MTHNPRSIKPKFYALAQERLRAGLWRLDPETGEVWGRRTLRSEFQKLRPQRNKQGYYKIYIYDAQTGKTMKLSLSRVVWEYVHGSLPVTTEINHKDGDKSRNGIANLEPTTSQGNIQHAWRTGLSTRKTGEQVAHAKLTAKQVEEIRDFLGQGTLTQTEIARNYGVSLATVNDIKAGRTWREEAA